jgi:hypothetical protein
MLTTNSESDIRGAVQSVRELEDRFNHKYNYPWIFLNDVPFSDDFKSCALSLLAFFCLLPSHMSPCVLMFSRPLPPQYTINH